MCAERRTGSAGAAGIPPAFMVVMGMSAMGVVVLAGIVFSISGRLSSVAATKADRDQIDRLTESLRDLDDMQDRLEEIIKGDAISRKRMVEISRKNAEIVRDLRTLREELQGRTDVLGDSVREAQVGLEKLGGRVDALAGELADARNSLSQAPQVAQASTPQTGGDERRVAALEQRMRELENRKTDNPKINEEALRQVVREMVKEEVGAVLQDEIRKFFQEMRGGRAGLRR